MIDGGDCGAIGGMKIDRGNRSTRTEPAPLPLCSPQIPHDQIRAQTQAATVGSQQLTAWAMARPFCTGYWRKCQSAILCNDYTVIIAIEWFICRQFQFWSLVQRSATVIENHHGFTQFFLWICKTMVSSLHILPNTFTLPFHKHKHNAGLYMKLLHLIAAMKREDDVIISPSFS
jgi:hypothetical protein